MLVSSLVTDESKHGSRSDVLTEDKTDAGLFEDTRATLIGGKTFAVTIKFIDIDGRPEVGAVTIAATEGNFVTATSLRHFALTSHAAVVLRKRAQLMRDLQAGGDPDELTSNKAFDRALDERATWIRSTIDQAERGLGPPEAKKMGRKPYYTPDHWQTVADAHNNAPNPSQPVKNVRKVMTEWLGRELTDDEPTNWVKGARKKGLIEPSNTGALGGIRSDQVKGHNDDQ